MRSFIATAAVITAALGGQPALADMRTAPGKPNQTPPFAEGGVFIPAGQTIEVMIHDICHRFTHQDSKIVFYSSPSQPGSWPSDSASGRAALALKDTEAPCE